MPQYTDITSLAHQNTVMYCITQWLTASA